MEIALIAGAFLLLPLIMWLCSLVVLARGLFWRSRRMSKARWVVASIACACCTLYFIGAGIYLHLLSHAFDHVN